MPSYWWEDYYALTSFLSSEHLKVNLIIPFYRWRIKLLKFKWLAQDQRVSDSQLKNQERLEICCSQVQTQDIAIVLISLNFMYILHRAKWPIVLDKLLCIYDQYSFTRIVWLSVQSYSVYICWNHSCNICVKQLKLESSYISEDYRPSVI